MIVIDDILFIFNQTGDSQVNSISIIYNIYIYIFIYIYIYIDILTRKIRVWTKKQNNQQYTRDIADSREPPSPVAKHPQ